jgi:hypothetical protein
MRRDLSDGGARRRLRRWFWGGFLGLLLVALLLALFAGLRGARQWAEQRLAHDQSLPPGLREVIQVTLSGSALAIDPDALPIIRLRTGDWLERRAEVARSQLLEAMSQGVDLAFAGALVRVPAYADWWYSLAGEYTRLYQAAFGDLPQLLAQRLESLVFGPADTAGGLDRLVPALDAAVGAQLRGAARDLGDFLTRLLLENRVDTAAASVQVRMHWTPATDLGERLESLLALSTDDLARQGLATSAGAAASALAVKKLGLAAVSKSSATIAGKQSVGLLAALAAKLGLKSAAKGGAALSGAGTGAALCAASGVGAALAPGCALVGGALTGVATWVLVDKAVLEADALLHREQLEQELRQALIAQREALKLRLRERYGAALGQGMEALGRAVLPAEPDSAVRRAEGL